MSAVTPCKRCQRGTLIGLAIGDALAAAEDGLVTSSRAVNGRLSPCRCPPAAEISYNGRFLRALARHSGAQS